MDKFLGVLSNGRWLSKTSAGKCQPPVFISGSTESLMLEKTEQKAPNFIIAKSSDTPTDVSSLNAEPFWCGLNRTYLWSGSRLCNLCNSNLDINVSMSQLNFFCKRRTMCLSYLLLWKKAQYSFLHALKGIECRAKEPKGFLPPCCRAIIHRAPGTCSQVEGEVQEWDVH